MYMELDAKSPQNAPWSAAMKISIKNSLDQKTDLTPLAVLCPTRQTRKQTNKIECSRLVLGIFSEMCYFLNSENQEKLVIFFFSFKIHIVMKKVLDNKCIPLASGTLS